MNKLIVEFIGTFFLILVVILSVIKPATEALAPLAVGAILMVMVYAGGHISGGHYNPGVTLGAWIRGKITGKEAVPYWIAQLLGAVAAALVSLWVSGGELTSPASYDALSLFIVEFLFTFALVYVVLETATSPQNHGELLLRVGHRFHRSGRDLCGGRPVRRKI